ncbi:MAG: hypothetical protein ACOVQJ_04655 [Bacteroidia bacterium]
MSLIAALFLSGFMSCKADKNKFSPEPFLELKGAYVFNNGLDKDSFVLVELNYRDGDGDVGLNPGDTLPPFGFGQPYYYNLLVWMYEKKNGEWIKPLNPLSPDKDTLNFHERIQNITPSGSVKWIQGNLDLRIPAEPYSLKPDTIRLEIQLLDRSLKRSNIIRTNEIFLKH